MKSTAWLFDQGQRDRFREAVVDVIDYSDDEDAAAVCLDALALLDAFEDALDDLENQAS